LNSEQADHITTLPVFTTKSAYFLQNGNLQADPTE